MSENNTKCKGCSGSVRVSESEIRRMLDEMQMEGAEVVSPAIYETRVSICGECEALEFKTTCRHCGCLIAIRAWVKAKSCPHPASPKW